MILGLCYKTDTHLPDLMKNLRAMTVAIPRGIPEEGTKRHDL